MKRCRGLPKYSLPFISREDRFLIEAPQAAYKRSPVLTREGGRIPIAPTFAESPSVNILLPPIRRGDDGAW